MLGKILIGAQVEDLPKWAFQLAELMLKTWSDDHGRYHNIEKRGGEQDFWKTVYAGEWRSGKMVSAVLVMPGDVIVAHTALRWSPSYGGGIQIGMSMALPEAPKGSVARLCQELFTLAKSQATLVFGRCLVNTTAMQHIASHVLGMRFAGIDFLSPECRWWEVLMLFDNTTLPSFVPTPGLLGDPLGSPIGFDAAYQERLAQFYRNLSTDRGGEMPPERAYILPKFIEEVRLICAENGAVGKRSTTQDKESDMDLLEQYQKAVESARQELPATTFMQELLADKVDPDQVWRFWLSFTAFGSRITAPVEGWIRRAGERCSEFGFTELGGALIQHAKDESGHDLLMRDDFYSLVDWRRERGLPVPVTASLKAVLTAASTMGMLRYIDLHERVISDPKPYGQLGIEYEIERMSRDEGPKMVKASERALPGIKSCLSFVTSHIALDIGHTNFNENQLKCLLQAHPDSLPVLIEAGREAISSYAAILDECWAFAKANSALSR